MREEFFERNLAALKNANPKTADKVASLKDGLYEVTFKSPDGLPNLLYNGMEPALLFYDPENPRYSIEAYLKCVNKKNRIVVLLGMGLGYVASGIIKHNKNLIKMIIVEKDPACLQKAMECCDLADIFNDLRVKIVAGCEERDMYIDINNAIDPHFPGYKDIQFLPWPASIQVSKLYYAQVMNTFQQIIGNFAASRGNDPYDTLVAYEQLFANFRELIAHPGAAHVKDLFKGKPAVVVATGPSLKKNIHFLKEIENSAVIISADASLRILHKNNIFPHLVTTIERPPGFSAYYKGLKNLDKTVFAAVPFVHPSTLQAYDGPRLFFHRLYSFMFHLGFKDDATDMGMSTANMAYEVARHMGCNPIILVGNDLSFDSSGNTHAAGFILGERQPFYDDLDKFEVPGNYETHVKTCDGWLTCIRAYESRIEGWDGNLINATEGGAKIRGAAVMSLKEAIARHCLQPFQPRETLQNHLLRWENPRSIPSLLSMLNTFLDVIDRFIDVSRKMRILLNATLCDIERAGDTLPPQLIRQIKESLPSVEAVLNNIMNTDLMKYFDEYFFTDILPLLMEWQVIQTRFENPAWADAYRIKLAEKFFGSLGQLCISLKEVLSNGKKQLLSLAT